MVEKEVEIDAFRKQLAPKPSYYDIKLKERKEQELKKDTELKNAFIKAHQYYKKKYPNSVLKVPMEWKESKKDLKFNTKIRLRENLHQFTEEQLYLTRHILLYSLKEHNYKKLTVMREYQEVIGIIVKLIPGGKYLREKERLNKDKREIQLRETEIERSIEIEKIELEKRLAIKEKKVEGFPCAFEGCPKILKTRSAQINHMKTHGIATKKEEPELKKLEM